MDGCHIRQMRQDDRNELAELIFHSTNDYYSSIGRSAIFNGEPAITSIIFDTYWQMDGDAGLVAVEDATGALVASCFVHPRETHVSLGIMNVHPTSFGKGLAKRIVKRIIDDAASAGKAVRLVSSCLNLDSYSLYTRFGFVPFETFQDMLVPVPENGIAATAIGNAVIRPATLDDVPSLVALETNLTGISRAGDYMHFISNKDEIWSLSVVDTESGIQGFMASCKHSAFNMIGPGVSVSQEVALQLIVQELNNHRGRSPVVLVPVWASQIVRFLYSVGARNCEMHVAQSTGETATQPGAIVTPTFLPETG